MESYYLGLKRNEVSRANRSSWFYFLGLWFGDGMRNSAHGQLIGNDLQYVASHEYDLINHCKENLGTVFKSGPRDKNDSVVVFTYSKEFTEFRLSRFSSFESYKEKFDLSDLSLQEIVNFIAGWFDADGSVEKSNGLHLSVVFEPERLSMAEFIQPYLVDVGIRTEISKVRSYLDKRTNKVYNLQTLKVQGQESRKTYKELIGFCQRDKNDIINVREGREKDNSIPKEVGPLVMEELKENNIKPPYNARYFLKGKNNITPSSFKLWFSEIDTKLINNIKNGLRFKL